MASTVWKGHVSFGLVSFPIRLHAAARPEGVHFHMLHKKDMSRVKEVWFCAEENKRIERDDMVKGYEASKGHYVAVEDEELKAVAPATATTLDIVQFVKNEEVDPIYFQSSYYVAPEEHISKPYALFEQALVKTGYFAIGKLTMHGREHVVLIRPADGRLVLHTLYYDDELHKANKAASTSGKVSAKELDLAKDLIQHLAAPFKPEQFHDSYKDNVQALIRQKQKGKKIEAVPQPRKAPVVDLMEALKESLKSGHASKAAPKRKRAA